MPQQYRKKLRGTRLVRKIRQFTNLREVRFATANWSNVFKKPRTRTATRILNHWSNEKKAKQSLVKTLTEVERKLVWNKCLAASWGHYDLEEKRRMVGLSDFISEYELLWCSRAIQIIKNNAFWCTKVMAVKILFCLKAVFIQAHKLRAI